MNNYLCLFNTSCDASSSHGVEELKLKPSKYSYFHDGEEQQGSHECLLLLMDIMDKGFVHFCLYTLTIFPIIFLSNDLIL